MIRLSYSKVNGNNERQRDKADHNQEVQESVVYPMPFDLL